MFGRLTRFGLLIALLASFAVPVTASLPPGKYEERRERQTYGAIAGLVVDAHGHGVAGAFVELVNQHHHVIAHTHTDHHGHFHFHHISPGEYTVFASHPHLGHGAHHVTVHGNHTSHVTVVLHLRH